MVKFEYEKDIWKKFIEPKKIALLLKKIEEKEQCKIIEVNYQFISDKKILEINNKFLNHNYYTDVIAFPRNRGTRKMADIYVSVDGDTPIPLKGTKKSIISFFDSNSSEVKAFIKSNKLKVSNIGK